MELVVPVGVVGHQEDLQEDHQEVVEVALVMEIPGVRSLDMGAQFQQPGLNLSAHCALRPQLDMLEEPSQACVRG